MADEEQRAPALTAALAISGTFVALTAWSWGRWTDPQIDYGNELYIAWQLAQGKVLYGDLAQRNGPLSHYWNALLFHVFGVSLRTLVWANLAVLAASCALAFALLRRIAGVRAATLGVLVFLACFGFSQYGDVANYNYVTPYHHFQTHGIALGLALLLALLRTLESGGAGAAASAGLCLGALLLTKLELSVPALAAALTGLGLIYRARRAEAPRLAGALLAGTALVPALFFVWLARSLPLGQAAAGVLGNFAHLGNALVADAFYRSGAGLDAPGANALRIVRASAVLLGLAGATLAGDRALARRKLPAWLAPTLGAALFALLASLLAPRHWFAAAAALPAVALGAVAGSALALRRNAPALPTPLAALMLFSVWACLLLAKLGLAPRFVHYGFALAMPASLLLVVGWVAGVPRLAGRVGGDGRFARAVGVALVAAAVFGMLRTSNARYRGRELWVGPPADRIRVENPKRAPRGARMEAVRERLASLLAPEQTLLVYPEGAMLNYWLRRENPSRFLLFLPTELDAFGRENVLADLRASTPDFVVLLQRGHENFGLGPFGSDPRNGRDIVDWVHDEYERIERIGATPFTGHGFGAEIWRRKGARHDAARVSPS